jgi:shikimate dehydrogenase
VNLTVPHKVQAVALVAGVDRDGARRRRRQHAPPRGIGWRGFNTDGYGLSAAIARGPGRSTLRGTPVLLLGAGGAARGAAVECLRAGCAGSGS